MFADMVAGGAAVLEIEPFKVYKLPCRDDCLLQVFAEVILDILDELFSLGRLSEKRLKQIGARRPAELQHTARIRISRTLVDNKGVFELQCDRAQLSRDEKKVCDLMHDCHRRGIEVIFIHVHLVSCR